MQQQEKTELAKKRILHSALQLFAQHGYEETSMADIAQASELSKGGMYHHFKSKAAILACITTEAVEHINRYFDDVCQNQSLSAAEKLSCILSYLLENPRNQTLVASNWADKLPLSFLTALRNTLNTNVAQLTSILVDGNARGQCHCQYPEEVAMVLAMLVDLALDPSLVSLNADIVYRRLDFIVVFLETFGAPLVDHKTLLNIKHQYKEWFTHENQ